MQKFYFLNHLLILNGKFQKKWKKNGTSICKENVMGACGLNPFKSKKLSIGKTKIKHVGGHLCIIQHVKNS